MVQRVDPGSVLHCVDLNKRVGARSYHVCTSWFFERFCQGESIFEKAKTIEETIRFRTLQLISASLGHRKKLC